MLTNMLTTPRAMAALPAFSTRLAPVAMAEMTKEDLAEKLNPAIGCAQTALDLTKFDDDSAAYPH